MHNLPASTLNLSTRCVRRYKNKAGTIKNIYKAALVALLASVFFGCTNPWMLDILQPKTITFDTNGGSYIESQTVYKNERIDRPSNPTKRRYTFDGWYTDNGTFLHQWDFSVVPTLEMTSHTYKMTLYANWYYADMVITAAAITVTAPVTGAAPSATATGAGNFTIGAVSWSPGHNPFQAGAPYTATVTLTANGDYAFSSAPTATINGRPATVTNPTETTLTLSYTFMVEMVWVAGGTFEMGKNLGNVSDNLHTDVTPVHPVRLTSGFFMGKYEVTQAQYKAVTGSLPSSLTGNNDGYVIGDNYPVHYVSWYDALAFCNKLSIAEGLTPAYSINGSTDPYSPAWGSVPIAPDTIWDEAEVVSGSTGYRLPTEAQWEYAAKGGNPAALGWVGYTYAGSDTVDDVAWYSSTSGGRPNGVGTKNPNGLGLYDMSGNVFEWCWDSWGNYTGEEQTDPAPSSGGQRVVRGGYFGNQAGDVRSVARLNGLQYYGRWDTGFRVVRP